MKDRGIYVSPSGDVYSVSKTFWGKRDGDFHVRLGWIDKDFLRLDGEVSHVTVRGKDFISLSLELLNRGSYTAVAFQLGSKSYVVSRDLIKLKGIVSGDSILFPYSALR